MDPVTTHHLHTYRRHARFVRMTSQNRELLVRYITHIQREHLKGYDLA